jgi:hypothetical protein
MHRFCALVAAVAVILLSPERSRADIIASEHFEYGGAGGSLAGNNGGFGFSGGWADHTVPTNPSNPWTYTPTGLTFGSLDTAGGAASWSDPVSLDNSMGIASRAFSSPLSGVVYGGFLLRVDDRLSDASASNTAALLLGQPGDTDNTATFSMNTPEFGEAVAGQRLGGGGQKLDGEALAIGETYLALFRLDSAAGSVSGWILNVAQYENFVAGGLTESALDAAQLGGGATDVFERGSFSTGSAVASLDALVLFGAFGELSVTFDEIRFSNSSLGEVAPQVPEPSALTLAAIGAVGLAATAARRRAK